MDEKQFQTIEKKLDILIGLLAQNLTKDKTLKEQVEILNSIGLNSGEIARALGKSLGSTSKTLDRIRKK